MTTIWTRQYAFRREQWIWRPDLRAIPSQFHLAAATAAVTPTVATVLFSEVQQIFVGGGYPNGGWALPRNATGFGAPSIDALNNLVRTVIADQDLLAVGDSIPASGAFIRWLLILDDNVSVPNREVFGIIDPETERAWPQDESMLMTGAAIEAQLPS